MRAKPGWLPAVLLCLGMCGVLIPAFSSSTLAQDADAEKGSVDDPAKDDSGDESKADESKADESKAAEEVPEAVRLYRADSEQWKAVLTDLRKLQARYQNSDDEEAEKIKAQWGELLSKARQLLAKMHESGMKAYLASPNTDRGLTKFLLKLMVDEIERDEYELAGSLAQAMIDKECDDNRVYDVAGTAAFVRNDLDAAEKYLKVAKEAGTLSDNGSTFLALLDDYKKFWEEEKKLRDAEAEKNDLPRVKLTTSKGDIVVELFENEAPETVANFISLVNDGFYNDKIFHRVLPGFMAQGGCSIGDGSGGPGYNIFCECYKENHRKHFRGSLSMAHAGKDTGGSQFFLTFVPTASLNGRHTVFGRVVEGMGVLAKMQRIDPSKPNPTVQPDKIVKAEVVRKRDHEYVPRKVEQP